MTKAQQIIKQISLLNGELKTIQSKCKHNKATYKHGYNSGIDFEHIWKDFTCPTCGKVWKAYNYEEEYNKEYAGELKLN